MFPISLEDILDTNDKKHIIYIRKSPDQYCAERYPEMQNMLYNMKKVNRLLDFQ